MSALPPDILSAHVDAVRARLEDVHAEVRVEALRAMSAIPPLGQHAEVASAARAFSAHNASPALNMATRMASGTASAARLSLAR